ncbi:MAG: LysR family transcriptional regulator [Halieaceae bacterium]|nr:LysR family transcriptional regulator [Halieaceae bacterium]
MTNFEVFLAVVECGSFSKAAESLGITQPAVSKQIDRMEKSMEVTLFRRSTRQIKLTHAGELYYKRVKEIVGLIDSAQREVRRAVASDTGRLKISCTIPIAHTVLLDVIDAYGAAGNRLNYKIKAETHYKDSIGLDYDLYIREGDLRDSSAIARKAMDSHYAFYASPDYVENNELPKELEDFVDQQLFVSYWTDNMEHWMKWMMHEQLPTNLKTKLTANDDTMIINAVERGMGVAILPYYMARKPLEQGRLVKLDYEFDFPALPLYIIFQSKERLGVQERNFLEFFVEYCQENYNKEQQAL